ncbi:glucosaminidase domain-containing protein [Lutibacter sp.]|uniref:glucosaminidase domain-containing protein n=1 Tax=Lutibacter sp. TaxID=1925666 RepID=UPI00273687DB|nr:glucosaminidase domain-containing protein [Lutibacter sp.]MDP3311861.1 glucosaminidase domain-containing protein [Lutibacter sp.]
MKIKFIFLCVIVLSLALSCKAKKPVYVYKKPVIQKKVEEKKPETVEPTPETKKELSYFEMTVAYIDQFKDAAMESMREYKIPASIKLAQGILESSSGTSALTLRSNNHFGIKCHVGWEGDQTLHDDDEKGECFRVYKDPKNSFKDHSLFLTGRSRYGNLFKLDLNDYVSWANGLSEAGYATDRRYPAKLISLIERFELYKYDAQVLGTEPRKIVFENNSGHIVIKGDTLYSISKKYGVTVDDLKKLNNLESNDISIGQSLVFKK